MQSEPSPEDRGQSRAGWAQVVGWYRDRKPLCLALVMGLVAGLTAGWWFGGRHVSPTAGTGDRRILYYVDPMNPAHTSPEPGLAPCGMKLEPVYADPEGQDPPPANLPPDAVKTSPRKQQLIGVRLGTVKKAPYTHTLRALGKVAIDETRVYRLNAFVDGWILKVFNNSTGSLVMKNQSLASFYSRDFVTTQQAYFYALNTLDRIKRGDQVIESQLITTSAHIGGAEENL